VIGLGSVVAQAAADERAVIVAIVLARLLVPLLIGRFPLVIVVALVLDGIDNSLLALFTDVDLGPDGPYQSFDKALDIYYLAIAYLTMMRNWTGDAAIRIGQFLFYYRLVGVLLFELLDSRAMLLLFPNTFEFYFIVYALIALRFEPSRRSPRFWLVTAAALWVFVKLPQEYWIHVAQLDFTDTVAEQPWFGVLSALVVLALIAVARFAVIPRLPPPDWDWRLAAAALPPSLARTRVRPGVRWGELAEKATLLALLSVIFASILPTVEMSGFEVAFGVVAVVCASTAISTWYARGERMRTESQALEFAALLVVNLGLVYIASRLISDADDFPLGTGLFFAFLITLLITLYDAYKPIYDARFSSSRSKVTSARDLWRPRSRASS
jgi:hypothetical protein